MPSWWRAPIGPGDTGIAVAVVQRFLRVSEPTFGEATRMRVAGLQHQNGLPVTGVVDAVTADVLGERATAGLVPSWWDGLLDVGDVGGPVKVVQSMLGVDPDGVYDKALSDAVRRFQSSEGLPLSGAVDEGTAVALGEL